MSQCSLLLFYDYCGETGSALMASFYCQELTEISFHIYKDKVKLATELYWNIEVKRITIQNEVLKLREMIVSFALQKAAFQFYTRGPV